MTTTTTAYIDPETLTSHEVTLTRAQWTAVLQCLQASFLINKKSGHATRASFIRDIDIDIKQQLNPEKYGS